MSIFQKDDEAPAFNYIIRILSPVVFIIVLATILYKFSLDSYVKNIYLISIYYVGFRLSFNILTSRFLLINWPKQIIIDLAIISLSYISYEKIILTKQNLVPDFSTFAEELWIIIALFIYQIINKVQLSSNATRKRKENYIEKRFLKFKEKYHSIISDKIQNEKLIVTVYAIMIYEDFNRPKAIRQVEYLVKRISSKSRSLGIMQVKTDRFISDLESVRLAIEKIKTHYYTIPDLLKEKWAKYGNYPIENDGTFSDWEIQREILKNYNPDDDYIQEVSELIQMLLQKFNKERLEYTFENKTEA